jgi:hypothetical protein
MRRLRKLTEPSRLSVGSWIVGLLMGKFREVDDTMIRWRVNILLCSGDKMIIGEKMKEVDNISFKLWYMALQQPTME